MSKKYVVVAVEDRSNMTKSRKFYYPYSCHGAELAVSMFNECIGSGEYRRVLYGTGDKVERAARYAPPTMRNFYKIKEWLRDECEPEDIADGVKVRFGYKIHGFKTANGLTQSANTLKWYEDYDRALAAAEGMVRRTNKDESIVIYKAIKLVRKVELPVQVEDIDIE